MNHTLLLLCSSLCFNAFAGGVKGMIKSHEGSPLPFASIYIKQTESGAASDISGHYEIMLKPGRYELFYRYLGYEPVSRAIEVGEDFVEVNITMKPEIILLQAVTVKAGQEDPAYTIMRKAIAKAKFHLQQIDSYSARVYIKGKGKVTDYPWFAKSMLEKEGITKDRLFISESVSEIHYTRPGKFEEKVIAVYVQGRKQNASLPNSYIFGSFYRPEVAETVSPLSPKAFSFYKFEYLGTVKDGKYEVSKIKVIPHSKGDNVFEGIISIVEDRWSIHSVDVSASKEGVHFQIKQIYNPIEDKAWLPVSQQIGVNGKVLGFVFEASYQATVSNYKITLNPAFPTEMHVIDEKLEKEEAQKTNRFSSKNQQLKVRLENGKQITRKELKQLTKAYEKAEQKRKKDPDIIFDSKYKVDSAAYKKDTVFWKEIRPQPLDKEEIRGYRKKDSLDQVQSKIEKGDTLTSKRKKKGFRARDILIGNSYKTGKTSDFKIHTPWGGFNTVEGVHAIYQLSYYKRWVSGDTLNGEGKYRRLEISPAFRYALARRKFTGFLKAEYKTSNGRFKVIGGRYIQQFNREEPILPALNTFSTLFDGHNYMKLFERDFIDINYRQTIKSKFTLTTSWSLAKRYELFNNRNYSFYKKKEEHFTHNAPVNAELPSTGFADHTAFIGHIGLEGRPWQKYYLYNGKKYPSHRSSPILSLEYKKGFSGIFGSEVNYDLLEAGIRDKIRLGIRGYLDFKIKAGKFLNTKSMYFMDYQHFTGNLIAFITADPVGSFRLLDYYQYSTRDRYFSANIHYNFRKFLFTQITVIHLAGISENLFVNYLATPYSGNYTELGYGLNGILRALRLEFATSFQQGKYTGNGFRIGISTKLAAQFSDDN